MAVLEITEQPSPSWKTYGISVLIGMVLGSGVGWWAHHTWTDSNWRDQLAELKLKLVTAEGKLTGAFDKISSLNLLNVELSKELVKAKANVQVRTEVAYVDKVVYKDPVTGVVTTEKTDVDITSQLPKFIGLRYNGKDYEIPLRPGEVHKFDSGKLLVTQNMSGNIDIVTKQKRGLSLDLVGQVGGETNGFDLPRGFGRVMLEARVPLF